MIGFRSFLVVAHRWMGLSTTLVLAIVGTTGSLIIWFDSGFIRLDSGFIRRAVGKLHQSLAIGEIGVWIVILASAAAVVLELTGLVLWWRSRSFRVRVTSGWRRLMLDVHYSAGAIGFVLMLVLAVTAVFLPFVTPQSHPGFRALLMKYHTTVGLPLFAKVLFSIASLGFLVQGATGLAMWWNRSRGARRRALRT